MKKRIVVSAIVSFFSTFFYLSNAQKYGIFQPIGKYILFVDSLKAKRQTDWQIDQIKNNRDTTRVKLLDNYNLAICYMAKEQIDSVIIYLKQSINIFPAYNRMILSDSDFGSLHSQPCWKEITSKIDSALLATIPKATHPKLAVELFHLYVKDQYARGYGLKFPDKSTLQIDSINQMRIEQIINEYGWPTYTMVGKVAADGAFMIIQHSKPEVQKKYIETLRILASKKEASPESVAMLWDRILVNDHRSQLYGTQVFRRQDPVTHKLSKYAYYPIEDEANVDIRRKEMGLIPLKEYLKMFGIDYVPGTKFQMPTF